MECSSHEWTAENENRKKLSSIVVNVEIFYLTSEYQS